MTMTPWKLPHAQWSKKFDHGHGNPGIFPVVNGQNRLFGISFVVKFHYQVDHFDHKKLGF